MEAAPDRFVDAAQAGLVVARDQQLELRQKDYVEEQAFIAGLSGYLSGIHADRVEPSMKDGKGGLKLTFRI